MQRQIADFRKWIETILNRQSKICILPINLHVHSHAAHTTHSAHATHTHTTHAAHTSHATATTAVVIVVAAAFFLFDGEVGNQGFRGKQQTCNAGAILQSAPRHLYRVNDTGLAQVGVGSGQGVVAVVLFLAAANIVNDDRTIDPRVFARSCVRESQGCFASRARRVAHPLAG